MKMRTSRGPKSITFYFDTREQAVELASIILAAAADPKVDFPNTSLTCFHPTAMPGKSVPTRVEMMARPARSK